MKKYIVGMVLIMFSMSSFAFTNMSFGHIHFRGSIIADPQPAEQIGFDVNKVNQVQTFIRESVVVKDIKGAPNLKEVTVTYE